MDNTTLKAQIDSQITNETTPLSITPADVGGNLKAVVDYVDQQVPAKLMHGLISQSSTNAPTIVYLKNDTGLTVSLVRTSQGRYTATLSSPIIPNKTSLMIGTGLTDTIITAQFQSTTLIQIRSFIIEAGSAVDYDDSMDNIAMKLEIYP